MLNWDTDDSDLAAKIGVGYLSIQRKLSIK